MTLLRLKYAAKLLGVSNDTLKRWEAEGKLNCSRTLGNQRRVPLSEVERLQALGCRSKNDKSNGTNV